MTRRPSQRADRCRPNGTGRWTTGLARLSALAATFVLLVAAGGDDGVDTAVVDTSSITGGIAAPPAGTVETLPAAPNPVRAGEYLKFSVQYGPIHAGSAYLEVPKVEEIQGHKALMLQARAESNGFFSTFYKVRNKIQSYWDEEGRFSLRYVENRREGGYKAQNDISFDYDRLEAIYKDGKTYAIPPHVQDALSAFYYTRTQALPLGGSIVFDYHASRKSLPLEVKVLGREKIETPAGKFNCVAVEPILKAGGIFKKKGRLVIWLTDDDRRMPVLMKSKVTVGSISVVLQEYRTGA
jgi:hypothetical protein